MTFKIDVVTLFPEMVETVIRHGVVRRAAEKGIVELGLWNPREYTEDRHKTVDDRPYGGGPGMVMKYKPLRDAVIDAKATAPDAHVVYLSPQGRKLDQSGVKELSAKKGLILIAGRYEGIDERFIESEVDEEWSIGDYVISGGELAAMVVIDAVVRMFPGALGDSESAEQDSFMQGLLDCPHYTRPEEIEGMRVPEVLLGGNHQSIDEWRLKQALGRTWIRRPDLITLNELDTKSKQLLEEYLQETTAN